MSWEDNILAKGRQDWYYTPFDYTPAFALKLKKRMENLSQDSRAVGA
jgi:hypothetical protein